MQSSMRIPPNTLVLVEVLLWTSSFLTDITKYYVEEGDVSSNNNNNNDNEKNNKENKKN